MEEQSPPQQPPPQRPLTGVGMNVPGTLPIPGNAEFALYVVILVMFAILWAATDSVNANTFLTATTVLTAAYFISRGVAKASRVYEQ
jgi:hypothetical protein